MNVLDLFSGIGGFSLGFERAGWRTAAFCEQDPKARKILKKHWDNVPIFEDVREVTNERLAAAGVGKLDVVCGGFPCQDISAAWDGPGIAGRRSGLWGEFARIIGEVQPRFAVIENVSNLRKRGLVTVLNDLACMGYNADWGVIPASAVGHPHQRDRMWIVAQRRREPVVFSDGDLGADTGNESFCRHCRQDFGECSCLGQTAADDAGRACTKAPRGSTAHADGTRRGEQRGAVPVLPEQLPAECYRWSEHEPPVGRVADGVPDRSYRIQKLGNAVTPFIPWLIAETINRMELTSERSSI